MGNLEEVKRLLAERVAITKQLEATLDQFAAEDYKEVALVDSDCAVYLLQKQGASQPEALYAVMSFLEARRLS